MINRSAWMLAAVASVAAFGAAAAQTPIPPATRDFVTGMVQADTYEICAAEDAAVQSRDPQIRSFAQRMIADHTRLRASLRQAAGAAGLPPPPEAMSNDEAHMLYALQSLRGPDFDHAYARQQVLAHVMAIDVVQSYAHAGADPTIRAAARSAAPIIQQHLEMARQLPALGAPG